MPRNAKIDRACKAMKNMGYSEKIVRPVMKELLKLYENNWMLIEEDSYQVLVDAILDSEEQKARPNELEHLNAWSEDEAEENEPPLKRSKLSSQKRRSSTSFYASIPNSSNEVENQPHGVQKLPESIYIKHQDKYIELKAPRVSKYCHGNGKTSSSPRSLVVVEQAKETNFVSDDESDKSNSPAPLAHLETSGGESDIHYDFSEKRMITYERCHCTIFSDETGKLHDDIALEEEFDKHLHEAAFECEPLSYDLPSFGVPPDSHSLLLKGSSDESCPNVNGNCSILPEVMDLDAQYICSTRLLPKDVYSIGNSSDLEGNNSETMNYKQSKAEKNEIDAQESLKLDIASSSRGEVKISLMVKPSLKSDLHAPSLEEVLKQVEELCLKSYQIPQTDFSMLRLLTEVCECFLVAGTTSTDTEDVKPANVVSSLGISKDSNSETGPAEGIDRQLSLFSTILNDPFRIQNLFEVSPQIPRCFGSIQLDLSRCRIYLNVDLNGSSEMERNIMELNSHVPSSSRMMIVQKRCYHYISDIAKGQEAYEISLINELSEEQGPAFNYIPKNMTYQNAYVRFLLAHLSEENCCSIGDCLSLEIPCTFAGKTGFEFAYTPGCLLKEEFLDNVISMNHSAQKHKLFYCQDCPVERCKGKILSGKCKGHIMRKFIKECWYKCGCSMKCGNRVVQRGITAKLQVFRTPEQKGWGLRTLEDIPKGAFICEYVGEVITNRESFERNIRTTGDKLTYPVLLDADWSSKGVLKDEQALCLDATVNGNVARFINHRCIDANLVEIPVEVETPDHHYYHLALFTKRKVNALEELTWDYGIDYNQPVKAFQCLCGSKFCRDRKSLKTGESGAAFAVSQTDRC